jgi:hypothetical protein
MQMVMMKAFVLNKASNEATSTGSSSSDEWIPQNAQAAMDKILICQLPEATPTWRHL